MNNIISPDKYLNGYDERPKVTLVSRLAGSGEFLEVEHGPGGSWDSSSGWIQVAALLSPMKHRLGGPRKPFVLTSPSAAVVGSGDRLVGGWQGEWRAQLLFIRPEFAAATFERPLRNGKLRRRCFARTRGLDASDNIIRSLMNALRLDILDGSPSGPVFGQTVITALLHCVLEPNAADDPPLPRHGFPSARLNSVKDLIEGDLASKLSLSDMAAIAGMSTRQFCREFRASTGMSPHRYVLDRRVSRARHLIEGEPLSYAEVAELVGFADHSQMARTFRKILGAPPSYFRKSLDFDERPRLNLTNLS